MDEEVRKELGMKSTLDTVAFFKNVRGTLESLSDEDAGALMKALFAHDDGEEMDLSQKSVVVRAIYPLVAEATDRLAAKRMSKVRKPTANEPQTAAHNHNHNHNHSHSQDHSLSHDHNHPTDVGNKESVDKRFAPPTIRDVEDYAFEKGLNMDARRFVDFYESKGWMVGRTKMKDWKAAARNWAARDKERKKEPLPFEDLDASADGFKVWEAV